MTAIAEPPKRVESLSEFPYSRLQRFTVEQYHRMIASGALTEDDPTELLEGWLVTKMSRDPHHAGCLLRLQNRLFKILPDEWLLRVQSAVTTNDSEPEPDLAIVSAPDDKYFDHHPGGSEVALVVEVANTSLIDDRLVKGRIYARAQFPIYWIANLVERQIEVYTEPGKSKTAVYPDPKVYREGDAVPVVLLGVSVGELQVTDVLPPK